MIEHDGAIVTPPIFIMHPDDESLPVNVEMFMDICNVTSTQLEYNSIDKMNPTSDQYKVKPNVIPTVYYKIFERDNGRFEVIYYLFYMWQGQMFYCSALEKLVSKISLIGTHIGDWEHVRALYSPDGRLLNIRLSQHGDMIDVSGTIEGNPPIVYVARNAHAMYDDTFRLNSSLDTTKRHGIELDPDFVELPDFVCKYEGEWGNSQSASFLGIKYKGGSPNFRLEPN